MAALSPAPSQLLMRGGSQTARKSRTDSPIAAAGPLSHREPLQQAGPPQRSEANDDEPDLAEFHRELHKVARSMGGAAELFAKVDKNGDGEIDMAELGACVDELLPGARLGPRAIAMLFNYLDKDGGGTVDAADLAQFMADPPAQRSAASSPARGRPREGAAARAVVEHHSDGGGRGGGDSEAPVVELHGGIGSDSDESDWEAELGQMIATGAKVPP